MGASLRNTFESLVETAVRNDRANAETYDDLDIDDALDQGIAALESRSMELDLISAELERLSTRPGLESISLESLPEELQELFTQASLESFGFEAFGFEETVDGLSDFLHRFWQVYFLDFLRTFDWVTDLVKSSAKKANKYRDRISDARNRFNKKRRNLDQDQQKASYVMMENYWFTEKGFVKQPFAQLKLEHALSTYVLETYPKVIEKEMGALVSLAKSMNFSSPETIDRSLIQPLSKRVHPVYLFDKKYLGGRPYMMNTGLVLSGKKNADLAPIDQLGQRRQVKVTTRLMGFTANALVVHVIPDVIFSNGEIDKLLAEGDAFLDSSEKLFKEQDNMKRQIGALKSGLEGMIDHAKNSKDSSVKTDVRKVGNYAKSLIDAYWNPSFKMAKRNIDLVKGIAYLAGRLVAYSK
jgi:hypothetical protein